MQKELLLVLSAAVVAAAACGGNDAAEGGAASGGKAGASGSGSGGKATGGKGGAGSGGSGGTSSAGKGGTAGGTGGAASGDGGASGEASGGDDSGGTAGAGNASGRGGASSTGGSAGTGGSGGSAGSSGSSGNGNEPCELASTWTTVDDFQLMAGQMSNPSNLAVAPNGTLYAVGIARMGTPRWQVRRSTDGGDGWDSVDSLDGAASDVAVAPNGEVYVVGNIGNFRVVRRSVNGGDDWTEVDSFPLAANTPCASGAVVVSADGVAYAGGSCDSEGLTVRSSANGTDWDTVEQFLYEAGQPTRMGTFGMAADGTAFAGGHGVGMTPGTPWLVRGGTTDGSWTTGDEYQLVAGKEGGVLGFGGRTALYALGYALDADDGVHGIVRRRSDSGLATFTTVDDLPPTASTVEYRVNALVETAKGTLIAAGRAMNASMVGFAFFRRSEDGTNWTSMADYTYVAGQDTGAPGRLVEDQAGNVYGMIRGVDGGGVPHWIVRKLACE